MAWLENQNPVLLAFLATLFTWFVTALGSATVFFFKTINKRILNTMLGFASGVMMAAAYWSLLEPAIEMNRATGNNPILSVVMGLLSGAAFLLLDKLFISLDNRFNAELQVGIVVFFLYFPLPYTTFQKV